MKIFQFITVDGTVTAKVDMLVTDLNSNATVMHVEYNITNSTLTTGYTIQQGIANFHAAHPVFATLQRSVTTGAALKAIATANNFTLNMYDVSSALNSGGSSSSVLNASTTTTSTTHAPTTTTTTT